MISITFHDLFLGLNQAYIQLRCTLNWKWGKHFFIFFVMVIFEMHRLINIFSSSVSESLAGNTGLFRDCMLKEMKVVFLQAELLMTLH